MLSQQFTQAVTQCLGDEWLRYAANKRRGGDNAQKGGRYEDYFTAYRLAQVLCDRIANRTPSPLRFEQQAEAIVDDLVITSSDTTAEHYQCRNVQAISWNSGTHAVVDDFAAQARLSAHQGVLRVRTLLVLPSKKLASSLLPIPSSISTHSDVIHFPYSDGRLNRVVLENAALRASLAELARVETPTDDELANVLGALMHGILRVDGRGHSDEMLTKAQEISPGLIRLMPDQLVGFQLIPGFQQALARVTGLAYRLFRGFFHWEAFGMSGVYPHNCLSQDFSRFQQRVVGSAPTTFDEFEVLL